MEKFFQENVISLFVIIFAVSVYILIKSSVNAKKYDKTDDLFFETVVIAGLSILLWGGLYIFGAFAEDWFVCITAYILWLCYIFASCIVYVIRKNKLTKRDSPDKAAESLKEIEKKMRDAKNEMRVKQN